MYSDNLHKKEVGARRMAAIFEELAKRESDPAEHTKLLNDQRHWIERATELQGHRSA